MRRIFWSATAAIALLIFQPSEAGTVYTVDQLRHAVAEASPGDTIILAPGKYEIDRLIVSRPGTALLPITVRASNLGDAQIVGTGVEIIKVSAPYWVFENLTIGGNQGSEHAFHIVGTASHTIVRHNMLHDFDAMIKGNGEGEPRIFPNDVLIENNFMVDATPRTDGAPVTPIDVVGGKRWIARSNFIADFAKAGGNGVSYGAFFKGNSSDGVMERNLIICEWKTHGGVRIGLSLGGGGSGGGVCADNDCSIEHRNGVMRNNIILNCTEDVGIYLNKAQESKILNNSLFNTNGIDVRFSESSANFAGNIISGGIRMRDGGTIMTGENYLVGGGSSVQVHKGMVWFEDKIMGASKKYPSLISETVAKGLAGLVVPVDQWIGESRWGRGQGQLESLFADAARANFALLPNANIAAPTGVVTVTDDFCGHARKGESHSYGAIEYEAGGCDIGARISDANAIIAKAAL